MAVIKKLGDRVEKEHNQFLRDSQRIEDRSATAVNGPTDGLTPRGGMDFETLVGGSGATSIKADSELNGNWEDDVWGSILSSGSTEVHVLLPFRENGMANFAIRRRVLQSLKQPLLIQLLRHPILRKAFRHRHAWVRPLALQH